MPIMNGYQACELIITCYNDKKKNSKHHNIVNDLLMQPLMIAYSGFVDENVSKRATDAGFLMVIEAPITIAKIEKLILSEVKMRK